MSLVMAHSPADIIRNMLIALGIGTEPVDEGAWPVSAYSEKDTPDAVITVYNTPGVVDGKTGATNDIFEHYGYQIRVRATKNPTAAVKIYQMDQTLGDVLMQQVNVDDKVYIVCAVVRKGAIVDGGKESPTSQRNFYTLNAVSAIYRTV